VGEAGRGSGRVRGRWRRGYVYDPESERKTQTGSQAADEAAAILPIAICAPVFSKMVRNNFCEQNQSADDLAKKMTAFALLRKLAEKPNGFGDDGYSTLCWATGMFWRTSR